MKQTSGRSSGGQYANQLDALLAGRWAPASWRRIEDLDELPWPLAQLVLALPTDAWRAYADESCFAVAIGEAAGPRRLAVKFYDASAQLCAAGVWSLDRRGGWALNEVLDADASRETGSYPSLPTASSARRSRKPPCANPPSLRNGV